MWVTTIATQTDIISFKPSYFSPTFPFPYFYFSFPLLFPSLCSGLESAISIPLIWIGLEHERRKTKAFEFLGSKNFARSLWTFAHFETSPRHLTKQITFRIALRGNRLWDEPSPLKQTNNFPHCRPWTQKGLRVASRIVYLEPKWLRYLLQVRTWVDDQMRPRSRLNHLAFKSRSCI